MRMKKVSKTLTSGGWQAWDGPGVLTHASMDGTSLSSNVLTLYDGHSTSGPTVSTWTQDTDFGTTVPCTVFRDGNIVATIGTASANTHYGVPFARGLYIDKTGDTTHTAALSLLIKPLHKKTINLGGKAAATDLANVWDGPGILHGIRIRTDQADQVLGTADLLVKDTDVLGTSGKTLWTGTNYVVAGPVVIPATTTTGIDDTGAAVTTAATGSYCNPGIAFFSGLQVSLAGANTGAGVRTYEIDLLIEN